MKKKLALFSLAMVTVMALASMGISYANNDFVFFTGCGYEDNETTKEVGLVYAEINGAGTNLSIDILNAYPGYIAYINFTAKNTGAESNDPIMYLKSITIINPPEISVVLTDFFNQLLQSDFRSTGFHNIVFIYSY